MNKNKELEKLKSIKRRAKLKNLDFDLDYNWMCSKLARKNCEISGIPFDANKGIWYTQSIDRIDNNKGYTKDNCKVVLWGINVGKGSSSYEELYKISKAFINEFEKNGEV